MNKRIKKKQWTMWSKQYNKRWKKYCQRLRAKGIRERPITTLLECERIKEEIEEIFAIRVVRHMFPSIQYFKVSPELFYNPFTKEVK